MQSKARSSNVSKKVHFNDEYFESAPNQSRVRLKERRTKKSIWDKWDRLLLIKGSLARKMGLAVKKIKTDAEKHKERLGRPKYLLHVDNVAKYYGPLVSLRDVSFKVRPYQR